MEKNDSNSGYMHCTIQIYKTKDAISKQRTKIVLVSSINACDVLTETRLHSKFRRLAYQVIQALKVLNQIKNTDMSQIFEIQHTMHDQD